jgi:hypothetical protein
VSVATQDPLEPVAEEGAAETVTRGAELREFPATVKAGYGTEMDRIEPAVTPPRGSLRGGRSVRGCRTSAAPPPGGRFPAADR